MPVALELLLQVLQLELLGPLLPVLPEPPLLKLELQLELLLPILLESLLQVLQLELQEPLLLKLVLDLGVLKLVLGLEKLVQRRELLTQVAQAHR